MKVFTMKAKRCTKCKWFRHKRRGDLVSGFGTRVFDVSSVATYYCINRWWSYDSHRYFAVGDVCEDFEFKK